ncbi:MAG: glycosyltransferase [Candidatus Omnitrophica bacterium]|nr:glycosyltransferase [Candidatus Omnitrophota bacterium]MDD5237585.1 glycosyltransferase [Candidatus Omnitrophota bacterium]
MSAKRIILMYISEISGHHSATLAIEKAIRSLEPQTEILNINAFNYTNPISEKIINRLYMSVIKSTPGIWDYLYDNPNVVKNIEKIKDAVHKFNSPKFKVLFDEFKPDVVACTQAFPCGMVADFKKTYNSDITLVAVLTDYVPHSYWIYDSVNFYISPSEEVSQRLLKKGVEKEKIKAFGIPFDQKFNQPQDRHSLCQKFNLHANIPTILIMGGGHGLGPIKTIIESLENVYEEIQEIVVAGTNKKLYNSLTKVIKKCKKQILLFEYVDNINELMAISDIVISKPGGVTAAEVLTKGLPMIIVSPIPGQEANNTAYLTQKGAAIKLDEPEQINFIIDDLLENQDKLERLSRSASVISKPNSSLDIAKLLLE